MKQNVEEIITVSDNELIKCMQFCAERMKLVIEPTGCLGLAGAQKYTNTVALNSNIDFKDKKVGIIISGGNIDL
jgi:threonine dehydratase